MVMTKHEHGFTHILAVLVVVVVVVIVGVGILVSKKSHVSIAGVIKSTSGSAAEKAGSNLAGGNCSGSGPVTLSVSPMKAEDISSIVPYGLMVSEHVTPIDHQYFAPLSYDSPRDAYEVRAPANGHIVSIQHRTSDYSNFSNGHATDEYRVVIDYTCTFLSYFDLITSLSPNIQSQVGTQQNANVNIPVKAGQVIGKIGGQTLDFAVWDTTKTLSGFLVPDHYNGEPFKIYTADPLDYASPELKAFMLSHNPRKAQPISGKIDYDIDGKLAGNWFLKGQGGYSGNDKNNHDYWKGHFAFAPNNYDPSLWEISSGAWGENGYQFAINSSQPKPDTVGITNGLVKYELYQVELLADGKFTEGKQPIMGNQTITAQAGGQSMGCMLVQLTAQREMKSEGFPGQSCANLTSFDNNAKVYER
jgi:hypothetical protein